MTSGPRRERPTPSAAVAAAFDRIAADDRQGIWIELVDRDAALAAATAVERSVSSGIAMPLAGMTVAVKGNIAVAGIRNTAGCPTFGDVATASAPAVCRLEDAGAVVVGVTNMDQFATGLVGTRSPYGICPNPIWPDLISGGSSSGSAAAVAAGHVDIALGTDTAGSGRVPAAANGLVGLKPTRRSISRVGVVPACRSLDCVSIFARSVDEAAVVLNVMRDDASGVATTERPGRAAATIRVGVAAATDLDFDGDPDGPAAYESMVDAAKRTGVELVTVDVAPLLAAGRLLYEGAFVAERYEAVGSFVDKHPDAIDPVVREIIAGAADVAGWEVFRDLAELERLRLLCDPTWAQIDVIAIPTVPRIPTAAEVRADPYGPNRMLGRYTNFVNLLDLCALSLPIVDSSIPDAPSPDGPPPSLMLIAPAGGDELLVELAGQIMTGATR